MGEFAGKETGGSGAGAVDAAVLGAGSAGERKLLFQGLASAMDADGSVTGSDSSGFGEGFEGIFSKIDAADDLAVLGLQGGEDADDALADDVVHGLVRLGFSDEVFGPVFESAIFCRLMAVVIDNRVAQDAVEPGCGRLFLVQCRGLFHGADVGALQDIFRGGWSSDAALHELEKLAPLKNEVVDGFGLH